MGDGIATSLAGMFGGPANTTYGEKHRRPGSLQGPLTPGHPSGGRLRHRALLLFPRWPTSDRLHALRHRGRRVASSSTA
ncbi:MAG: hypothetical protein ACLU38_01655 [Dysosmobacter sp.]